jgi:hypothetical protein
MSDLASLNRSAELSSAAIDFTQYARAMLASRFRASDRSRLPGAPRLA